MSHNKLSVQLGIATREGDRMSHISLSLIIGSIFTVILSQALAHHIFFAGAISAPQILLACGLLYCAMKIYTSWLGAPPAQKVEDENNDQHNE